MSRNGDASTGDWAYDLEYRSMADDAWYTVSVVLDGDSLTVKFLNFSDTSDEKFNGSDFDTPDAVDEFCRRLRPVSEQLQDSQCSRVVEGMTVCASFASTEDDIRFFDAVVESVNRKNHSFMNGEEECLCTFVLCWQHGPNKGYLSFASVANMCLIEACAQVDPRVASFSKMAKRKIETAACRSSSVSNSGIFVRGKVDRLFEQSDHDRDLGGESVYKNSTRETGSHHFILVENLEKDLHPSSIVEFLHKETSISAQAYVFPSLLWESYARGAIVSDCKSKLREIYDFLNNPDHIIISSRGRPWVISEKQPSYGTFRAIVGSLVPGPQVRVVYNNMIGMCRIIIWTHLVVKEGFDLSYDDTALEKDWSFKISCFDGITVWYQLNLYRDLGRGCPEYGLRRGESYKDAHTHVLQKRKGGFWKMCNFQNRKRGNELKVAHCGTEEYMTARQLSEMSMNFLDHHQRLHKRLALEEKEMLSPSDAA